MVCVLALAGCSLQKMAVRKTADALTRGSGGWARDDDPELVGDALPFVLKTYESLLAEVPRHARLLVATCSGFVSYGAGWIEPQIEDLESQDLDRAEEERDRVVRLYLRARGYCLRALEQRLPGVTSQLQLRPADALAGAGEEDVELLYWTAAAWGSAIAADPSRPDLIADLPAVRALFERARQLDPKWGRGALDEALIPIESLSPMVGGSLERARQRYDEAVRLSEGRRASPHVTWARSAAVAAQDRAGFEKALEAALAVDVDASPDDRLSNRLAQREARRLLGREDELFFEETAQ